MSVELTPELIIELSKTRNGFYSWDYVAGLAVWIIGVEANNEHLQARIAELEQERRWIPVSERMPEDSRIYDVAIAGYEYSWTGTCVFGKWIGETGKPLLGVTHWKHRTQIPEEEE